MEGNPSKRALPENEPAYAAGIPDLPKRASAAARRIHAELAPEMMDARVLRRVDKRALWQLCEDEALLEELYAGITVRVRELKDERKRPAASQPAGQPDAQTTEESATHPRNPATALLDLLSTHEGRRLMNSLNNLGGRIILERREFGLTPSARTRINTDYDRGPAADNLELDLCG
jgi:hypothetical protein